MMSLPILLLTRLLTSVIQMRTTLEQYRTIPQPVHFRSSCPIASSTALETMKHLEHAFSGSSRTETNGSRLRRRFPAATASGETKPLPRGAETVDRSSVNREPESFVAI